MWSTLLLSCLLAAASEPPERTFQKKESIRIQLIEGMPFVKMEVNGKKAMLLLDTGAKLSLLHLGEGKRYGFAEELKKKLPSSTFGAFGKGTEVYEIGQISLKAGNRELLGRFFASDLSHLSRSVYRNTGVNIVGIFGMDLIDRYQCSILFTEKLLVFNAGQ